MLLLNSIYFRKLYDLACNEILILGIDVAHPGPINLNESEQINNMNEIMLEPSVVGVRFIVFRF